MLKTTTSLFLFGLWLQASISVASNSLPAEDRLKSCDSNVAVAAAKEIIHNPNMLREPLMLFSPAAVLFVNGMKDEGVFWFYAAQLRVRYQLVFEKGDRGQLLSVMLMTFGDLINGYAYQDVSNLSRILDRVLEWDKSTPNPFDRKPRTEALQKQLDQIYAGFRELKTKLVAEKSDLEVKARKAFPDIEQAIQHYKDSSMCGKSQLDPSLVRQETEREWSRVIEFVRSNKDVIREVGEGKNVGRVSTTTVPRERMPSKYEVSIGGNGPHTIYAIVDVSRSGGEANFTLKCITRVSLGYRDPTKDACTQ